MQPTFVATNIFVQTKNKQKNKNKKKVLIVSAPANDKYQEFHDNMVEFKVNVHGAFQASIDRFKWTC